MILLSAASDVAPARTIAPYVFEGTRHEIGFGIGRRFAPVIHRACKVAARKPTSVKNLSSVLAHAVRLLGKHFPAVLEEYSGMAAGAGIPFENLLLHLYEDLRDDGHAETGCTDIAADRRATFTGRSLVGHNNDEAPGTSGPVLIRLVPDDGPVVTAVTLGGMGIAVGMNDHGLVLSGNQVTAKDVKFGIPRILLVRAALEESTVRGAVRVLTHEERASSYNNVLADSSGTLVSVEGSGEKSRVIRPTPTGILTHSNHYLHPDMKPVEGKIDMDSTEIRERRSCFLMGRGVGTHTPETFAGILRDHHGFPGSICRHGTDALTGFSAVFEPETRRFWYSEGYPCRHGYRRVGG